MKEQAIFGLTRLSSCCCCWDRSVSDALELMLSVSSWLMCRLCRYNCATSTLRWRCSSCSVCWSGFLVKHKSNTLSSSHLIYPLTARVVRAPLMISQLVSSIFLCSSLPFGTWRIPGLPFPWCCLPTSSSVCLVFFPLWLCLARWFWPDLMNRRHVHTSAVCVSLRWSGGLPVVRLPVGSWHRLPRW